MLSPRRFPDTITRRRQGEGDYDETGSYVEGAVTETELQASVQPLEIEDIDAVGGEQLSERLKVYIPQPGALSAAFDDSRADEVLYGGNEYVVEESRSWPGSHTRATLLRQT